MNQKQILILDYSVDKSEAAAIKRWLPADTPVTSLFIDSEESFPDGLIGKDYTHVIHSGSALSITKDASFTEKAVAYIRNAREKGISQMGICYGHQLVCLALVGIHAVRSSPNGLEAGWNSVTFSDNGANILGVRESETIWQHHFDEVTELPEASELLASNAHCENQAYVNFEQQLLGTQFHPEFDKESGDKIFLEDRELLKKNGYDVGAMVKKEPSIDAGDLFFGYFLAAFNTD